MKMCFHEKTLSPIPGGISLRLGYGKCGRIDAKDSGERDAFYFISLGISLSQWDTAVFEGNISYRQT